MLPCKSFSPRRREADNSNSNAKVCRNAPRALPTAPLAPHVLRSEPASAVPFPTANCPSIAAALPAGPSPPSAAARIASGRSAEIFDLGDALLLVASDRLSAFDVILPTASRARASSLTQMSLYWFELSRGIITNRLLPDQPGEMRRRGVTDPTSSCTGTGACAAPAPHHPECVVRLPRRLRLELLPVRRGLRHPRFPPGLRPADRLPRPLHPDHRAPGVSDEPSATPEGAARVGAALYERSSPPASPSTGSAMTAPPGGNMILADLPSSNSAPTPAAFTSSTGSSRPTHSLLLAANGYAPAVAPSCDKRFVRDHLLAIKWDQLFCSRLPPTSSAARNTSPP